MNNKFLLKNQKGFSLIEMVIAVVIFSVVFITIARVLMTAMNSEARFEEQSEAMTRNSSLSDMLRQDFGNPLNLLSRSSTSPYSSGLGYFEPNADFEFQKGEFTRRTSGSGSSSSPIVSSVITQSPAGAQVVFSPQTDGTVRVGWHTKTASFDENFAAIDITTSAGTYNYALQEAGQTGLSRGTLANAPEKYAAKIENLSVGCRVSFYAVTGSNEQLLGRSVGSCPPAPLEVIADGTIDARVAEIEMSGSFTPRNRNTQIAPLPFVGNTQLTSPVFINAENSDVVVFRASETGNKLFSYTDVSFNPDEKQTISATIPESGEYLSGSYVFLVDYSSAASLICQIQEIGKGGDGDRADLTLAPVYTPSAGAWGLFYTPSYLFTGRTFFSGTEIILLDEPIMYRYLATDKLLLRRTGSNVWDTIGFGVNNFTSRIKSGYLQIVLDSSAEGVETNSSDSLQSVRFNFPVK